MAIPKRVNDHFTKENLIKSIFWIACLVSVLSMCVVTRIAVSGAVTRLEDRKIQLDAQRRLIQNMLNVPAQANTETIDKIKKMTEDTEKNVYTAWRKLADVQKKSSDMWSDAVEPHPNALPTDFLRTVRPLKVGEEIPRVYLEQFANIMDRQVYFILDKLQRRRTLIRKTQPNPSTGMPEIVYHSDGTEIWEDSERIQNTGRSGNRTGALGVGGNQPNRINDPNVREIGNVYWKNPEIRSLIQPGKILESIEVWYMLEDLLVYDALFEIINGTNQGAGDDPNKTVIKEIVELKLGKAASSQVSSYLKSQESGGSGRIGAGGGLALSSGMSGGLGTGTSRRRSDSDSSYSGSMGMTTESQPVSQVDRKEALTKSITEGRYVDDGQLEQFKRMPVALKLLVDQRYVSDFLVRCANSAIPIDVINVTVTLNQNGFETAQGRGMAQEYDSYTVPVEILGVITIFNSPDNSEMAEKFKAGKATENAAFLITDAEVQKTEGRNESPEESVVPDDEPVMFPEESLGLTEERNP